MKIKIMTGLLFSLLLVWLSLRGIDIKEVPNGLRKVNGVFVIYSMAVMILMQVLRAMRWGLILKPLDQISKLTLFSVTNVGFLAIVAIPVRLGEFVRPYLITKKSRISMGSALGTIFIERILDIFAVLIIAATFFFSVPLPAPLSRYGFFLALSAICISMFMMLILSRKEKTKTILARLIKILPTRYVNFLKKLTAQFIEGFSVIKNNMLLTLIVIISLSIWLADALAIYLFFLAFNLNLPITAPFVIMVVLIAGIAIPSAPGFIGNWHYACVLGLGFFGIAKTTALSFAVLYHAVSIGIIIILGLISLPSNSFSVFDFWHREKSY